MAHARYFPSKYQQRDVPLESQQDFFFRDSLLYSAKFERFAGAIVPFDCYPQTLQSPSGPMFLFHARLPVEPDLSRCHKMLWSAQYDTKEDVQVNTPDTLRAFAVLTCVAPHPDLWEEKVCDILFPGLWGMQLVNRYLCLWYGDKPLLQVNPDWPQGLIPANHQNLQSVLGGGDLLKRFTKHIQREVL